MEEIEVTTRFDPQGKIIPLNFVWRGQETHIDSIGRQWDSHDGSHLLVMDRGGHTYHLVYQANTPKWYLLTIPNPLPPRRRMV